MDEQNPNARPPIEPAAPGATPSLPTSPLADTTLPTPAPAEPQPAVPEKQLFAGPSSDPSVSDDEPNRLASLASGFSAVFGAIFSWIVFPIAVVLILHNFVFQAYHVIGTSMVPNLHDADYLIISKLGYTQALVERALGQDKKYIPARGQIIVFRFPKDTSRVFVKRVIGLPGDRVVVKNGTVTIYNKDNPSGFNPDAKYEAKDVSTLIDTDEVVQAGNVFVMGDNRSPNGSYDSREWGELPSSYIIGDAVLRLLPLDQVKAL